MFIHRPLVLFFLVVLPLSACISRAQQITLYPTIDWQQMQTRAAPQAQHTTPIPVIVRLVDKRRQPFLNHRQTLLLERRFSQVVMPVMERGLALYGLTMSNDIHHINKKISVDLVDLTLERTGAVQSTYKAVSRLEVLVENGPMRYERTYHAVGRNQVLGRSAPHQLDYLLSHVLSETLRQLFSDDQLFLALHDSPLLEQDNVTF